MSRTVDGLPIRNPSRPVLYPPVCTYQYRHVGDTELQQLLKLGVLYLRVLNLEFETPNALSSNPGGTAATPCSSYSIIAHKSADVS